MVAACVWFFYGWYGDASKPQSGEGWADQTTYTHASEHLAGPGKLTKQDLHFAVGYPLLGVLGRLVSSVDPFMAVSFMLMLASVALIFLAVRHLFSIFWATIFSFLLFFSDGAARQFHYASELFAMPWGNQVLFFALAYFLWLLVTCKHTNYKLIIASGVAAGLSFVTREESILFVGPLLAIHLLITKAEWRKWLVAFGLMGLMFTPQIVAKMHVFGSLTESGHDYSYGETLSKYFDPSRFYDNMRGVIIDSKYSPAAKAEAQRPALLQESPWLWLSPIGIVLIFALRRYPLGLKLFTIVSLFLMFFYLSGINMSVQKLAFHCLRYISPAFIVLNLAVLITAIELFRGIRQVIRHRSDIINTMFDLPSRFIGKIWRDRLSRAIEMLPLSVPASLASFGVIVTVLLLVGQLYNALVWPLGLAIAALTGVLVTKYGKVDRPGSNREQKIVDLVAIIAIIAWGVFNIFYTAQHIFINRDPAIYTNTAVWLISHPSVTIQTPDVFGDVTGITPDSNAFHPQPNDDNQVYAQGLQLFPSLMGLGGRVVGETKMMHLNPLFGMTALLAVYGFARLFVRPRFALMGTLVLAVSLPMIYFSRDTYTEPLAATFMFGALSLLWVAQRKMQPSLWLIAGLVAGAGTLTRIDGYLTVAALLSFLAILLGLKRGMGGRRQALYHAGAYALGMAVTSLLGWLSLIYMSPVYYHDLTGDFMTEMKLIALVVFTGICFVAIAWQTKLLGYIDRLTKHWRAMVVAMLIVVTAIVLVSRPLWLTAYGEDANQLVAGLQAATKVPVEPNRTYAEDSVWWVMWYVGPVIAALGVVGAAVAAYRSMRDKSLLLLPLLLVVLGTSLVYLIKPSISPDQVWASRRLLPVILPGIIILGVFAFDRILNGKMYVFERFRKTTVVVVSILIFAAPLFVTKPFVFFRPYVQYSAISEVCSLLPKNAAVLWVGTAKSYATQPTRSFCNLPAAGYVNQDGQLLNKTKLADIARSAHAKGLVPIIGVYEDDRKLIATDVGIDNLKVSSVDFQIPERTLTTPPNTVLSSEIVTYAGVIQKDGTVEPLHGR